MLSSISWLILQKLQVCGHMYLKLKWFYEIDKRQEGSGAIDRKESRKAKQIGLLISSECLWQLSLGDCATFSLLLYLSCSPWLPLCGWRRTGEREGGGRGEGASFHGDAWWKRTRKVLLSCAPLLFLFAFPVFFLKQQVLSLFPFLSKTSLVPILLISSSNS